MRKLLINADNFFDKLYKRLTKRFFGKVFLKLIGEIILALVVSLAVYLGSTFYENSRIITIENENLNKLYISVSESYVESLFGKPYISVSENEKLQSNFYLLKDAVLRTVVENDTVVAFFITSKKENRTIPVSSISSEKEIVGKTNYADIDFPNPNIESNLTMNGRYCYYGEIQGTGRYAMYNHYLFATIPYGFIDEESVNLCNMYSGNESVDEVAADKLRKKATPNTFGVIAEGYQETITLIPFIEEWENIYYLLIK